MPLPYDDSNLAELFAEIESQMARQRLYNLVEAIAFLESVAAQPIHRGGGVKVQSTKEEQTPGDLDAARRLRNAEKSLERLAKHLGFQVAAVVKRLDKPLDAAETVVVDVEQTKCGPEPRVKRHLMRKYVK